ncbi:NACHT and WD repeat domain-containing protein [Actinoplanes sp. CA-252034]|uniref:NACHT and WD repeat domain-containing protein n=1 Tax=Actinoplanes sp. CA-252034 TaxID=3239906 RepID=UPI003D96DDBA
MTEPEPRDPDRPAAVERARAGVRSWIREAGQRTRAGLRTAGPYGLLAFLTASAVAPVAGAALGATDAFAAALDQVGGLGSNYLADSLSEAAKRMRDRDPQADGWSEEQWRDAIAADLLPRLAAADERSRALHEEISRVLREVDAVGAAISEAATTDEELRHQLEGAFRELGLGVGELHWMITEVRQSVDGLRQQFAVQSLELSRRLEQMRRHLTEVTREQLPGGDEVPADVPGGVVPPYPGLVSFQPEDAARFRGRETRIAELLSLLAEQALGGPPLIVTGVSGAGKSSLLRAGLLPALGAGALGEEPASWAWVLTAPGASPLADLVARLHGLVETDDVPHDDLVKAVREEPHRLGALAAKAAAAGRRPIVVVDQFEELFTQCPDPAERLAYVTALATAAPALVVIAVRSDFYPACAALPPLAKILAAGHVVLGPLDAEAIRRAVVEPAEHAGLTVEPGLPDLLLRDLGADGPDDYEPGALPLLAHALRATWDRREGIRLTVAAYRATGGIRHAIAETAEGIYLDLPPEDRDRLRDALLGLVTVTGDGTAVRRRGERAASDSRVLRRLVKARLVTVGTDTVEISHEALLTSWPRLAGWVAEAREDLLLRQSVTEAARDWDRSGRDPDLLPRGSRLLAGERVPAGDGVPPLVGEYLAAGAAAAAGEQRARERANRRLRRMVAGLAAALLLAVAGGLVAVDRQRTADAAGRDARSRQYAAEAVALLDRDEPAAVRRALAAWNEEPTAEARGALLSAQMVRFAGRLGTVPGGYSAAVSPDGSRIAIGDDKGVVRLWDTASLTEVGPPLAYPATPAGIETTWVVSVVFSPDGRYLASGALVPEGVRIWDAATGELIRALPAAGAVDWLPDSATVVAGGSAEPRALGFWDAATGRSIRTLPAGDGIVTALSVSRDGRHVATAGLIGAVEVRRIVDGRRTMKLTGPTFLAFAPDGSLVTNEKGPGGQGRLRQWEAATGRKLRDITPEGHVGAPPAAFAVTGDGMIIAAATHRSVDLWSLTDETRGTLRTGLSSYGASASSANGQVVVVTSPTGPSVVHRRVVDTLNTDGEVHGAVFSPDGRRLAAGGQDGTVRIWDTATRVRTGSFRPAGPVSGLVHAADGLLGLITAAGTLELWDETGKRQASTDLGACTGDLAASPDGRLLAVTTFTCLGEGPAWTPGEIRVYDVDARRMRGTITLNKPSEAKAESSFALAFSPDGTVLHAAVTTGSVERDDSGFSADLRSWRTGDLSAVGEPRPLGPYQPLDLAIAPDGRSMAVTGTNRLVDIRSGDGSTSLWTTSEQGEQIDRVAFSPDGRTLAVSDRSGPVQLWDTTARAPLATLRGHVGVIAALAFSPDGGRLVSGSFDSLVSVWPLDPAVAGRKLCAIATSLSRDDGQPVPDYCRRFRP